MSDEIKAYLATENTTKVAGIVFAESAGVARVIVLYAGIDCGYKIKITDITVNRKPEYDNRRPEFFSRKFFQESDIKEGVIG